MNLIITGADGFVGTNLVSKLINTEHKLLLIGNNDSSFQKALKKEFEFYSYKNLAQSEMSRIFKNFNPDCVIHLAAYSTASDSFSDVEKLIDANLLYLVKILDALKNVNLDCFIYTGTFAEFFNGNGVFDPSYIYAATKTAGRFLAKYYASAFDFKLLSICPYTIYGGVDTTKKIIDFLYESLDSENPVDVTDGEQVLDFFHVYELADLYIEVAEKNKEIPDETIIYGGTGIGHTLKDLVKILEGNTGLKANINWGGRQYRKRDVMYAVADISKQKELLSWSPKIDLNTGVKIYIQEKKSN